MSSILFNALLHLSNEELANTKIRFNKGDNKSGSPNPLDEYLRDHEIINTDWFLHRTKNRPFRKGQYAICLVRMSWDRWLFTTMKTITEEIDTTDGVAYEAEECEQFAPFFGRVILKFHSSFQQPVPFATTVMDQFEVLEILADSYGGEQFSGYDNVRLSYGQLNRIVDRGLPDWTAALENQKGVYVITDRATGKLYVGSATSENGMLLGRWASYISSGHGGNLELVSLIKDNGLDYARENFQFSLLENYNASVDDHVILQRESWWKETLASRRYGYNAN